MKQQLLSNIMTSVKKAQKGDVYFEEIFSQNAPTGKNEFLLFIKPEILLDAPNLKNEAMVSLILDKIAQFGLTVHNAKTLSAKYLEDHNIIAQHYGVINKIATDAKNSVSQSGKEKFKELYNIDFDTANVMGGMEFIKKFPEFTPYTLDILWQAQTSKKLAGGTYAEAIKMDDATVYLINGFHPRQLYHFTQKGRAIIVMTVSGDTSWVEARDKMIGNTFPDRADAGSIRREFFDRMKEFGLPEVSIASNGIHLSAGPVEGLIELTRYNSDFSDKSKVLSFDNFAFGKKMQSALSADQVKKVLSNVNVTLDGKSVSVFDMTEMMDSDQALETIKKHA
jgi:nucleoside diphosphate kinase